MKQYFIKAAGASAVFALIATSALCQEEKSETTIRRNDDVIVIKPKVNVDTKLTIEIKGEDVKINGRPLEEFKNDDISVSRRKESRTGNESVIVTGRSPASRFRGGSTVYGYGGADNSPMIASLNTNKAFLGVGTENTATDEGITVTSVTKEGAAEKAGIKEGDIITMINDTKMSSPGDLRKAIGKFKPDDKVTITYKRNKKEQKTTAVLMKSKNQGFTINTPDYNDFFNYDNHNDFNFVWGKPRLGLKAQETEEGKGLKVLGVDDESAAEKAGIKEGDIITAFDGTEVNNIDKLRELSKPALEKSNFKVKLTRDGKTQEVEIKIPKNLKTTNL